MEHFLPVLIVLVMLATLGVLLFGIISMAKGGNPMRSNKLMQWRVILQFGALLLFVIFMLVYRR
jgi:NADH:ubiquinone oxidoreductase subunit 6 (subunit J)